MACLVLDQSCDIRSAFAGGLVSLLLELVFEETHKELPELLRILLLALIELEGHDERLGVVDGLLSGLEEGEEHLKLEQGR